MNTHIHKEIDLKNTKIVWECEDCGESFEDDGSYQSDICPECGSGNTMHVHVSI